VLLPRPSAFAVRGRVRVDVVHEDGDLGDINDAASMNLDLRRRKCSIVGGPTLLFFLRIVWTK
jgi:hypothetical protein